MATRSTAVSNNSQGWGVAAFVTLLALVCALSAWYIHKETYRSPRDPMFRQRGDLTPTGGEADPVPAARSAGEHGAGAKPEGAPTH